MNTPTLSVAFHRARFTEPFWVDEPLLENGITEIRVVIQDEYRQRELEKNLGEWLKSPTSLLLFRHIRCLQIDDHEVRWVSSGEGPVARSEWMALSTSPDQKYLLLRSEEQSFPDDALTEIRQERMLAVDEETVFPPCQVEIILGMEGRLFVILPTNVKTALPFACNAPFVQDPARVKIKDPEISETNRWLLKRVGTLAAEGMLAWLWRSDLDLYQRCEAYRLFPDVDRKDSSLEGSCATIVEEAFEAAVRGKSYLLSDTGDLKPEKGCVTFPQAVIDTWSSEQASALFDAQNRPALCRGIAQEERRKLVHWGLVEEYGRDHVLSVLESSHPPKPGTWRQLLTLWAYVEDVIWRYHHSYDHERSLRIVPVQGQDVLYAAGEVVRLGEEKLLHSKEDWNFLAGCLLVMNQNWPRYIAEQRRIAKEHNDEALGEQAAEASRVLDVLGLNRSSDVSQIMQRVADSFFAKDSLYVSECVRLAQIAANLGATVSERFKFVTRDMKLRTANHQIVADPDGSVEEFVTQEWAQAHFLHEAYCQEFNSCSKAEWEKWVSSERSRLLTFVPFVQVNTRIWGREKICNVLAERGLRDNPYYPYVTSDFVIEDWDFGPVHWKHWHESAKEEAEFWGRLVTKVLSQPQSYSVKATSAKVFQVATTGTYRQITHHSLLPAWILSFRKLPCLRDTRGFYHQPAELLCRTPATEPLFDVESFVHAELDTVDNRPLLLKLGVRDTPSGPDRLLDCLRALAKAGNPPAHEVEKWYLRLDKMLDNCSTEDFQKVKQAFESEKIVLTGENGWASLPEVFLLADEDDAPGAATVLPSVCDLALWRRVGMAERPTADLAIAWLNSLPSEKSLTREEARRVHSLLARHPLRVWNECGHWLNIHGEWVPVESIAYSMNKQSTVPKMNLFSWVGQKTADFQHLVPGFLENSPFSEIPTLASQIEDRLEDLPQDLGPAQRKRWLAHLGSELCRVVYTDEIETTRIRSLATRLAATSWQQTSRLETIPYINGTPAGTGRSVDVLWRDAILFVLDRPMARIAKSVSHELGRVFQSPDIADALKLCFDRSPDFISDYLEENFRLASVEEVKFHDAKDDRLSQTEQVKGTGRCEGVSLPLNEPTGSTTPSSGFGANVLQLSASQGEAEAEPSCGMQVASDISQQEETEPSEEDRTTLHRKQPPKSSKPTVIERFAQLLGYTRDTADRFFHADGSWIAKTRGEVFQWERRSAGGELVSYYWPKDHCLQQAPLELEAEVWGLCDKFPDQYALILCEEDGTPVEINGYQLRGMCNEGRLTLHPAAYRLVYKHDPAG